MTSVERSGTGTALTDTLSHPDASLRLRAALAAGSAPVPEQAPILVGRLAREPDFFVRDMLTWALTRLPGRASVPLLIEALNSGHAEARPQVLHTLSKLGDRSAWPHVRRFVHDRDDDVVRAAWRAAVALVPVGDEEALAADLAGGLGKGGRDVRMSLSRALVALGDAAVAALEASFDAESVAAQDHARATLHMMEDPEGFDDAAVAMARRVFALGTDEE